MTHCDCKEVKGSCYWCKTALYEETFGTEEQLKYDETIIAQNKIRFREEEEEKARAYYDRTLII